MHSVASCLPAYITRLQTSLHIICTVQPTPGHLPFQGAVQPTPDHRLSSAAQAQDFGKIAGFLDTKTQGDCVVFFYKNQKLDEFAAVRRKQQLKKRRDEVDRKRIQLQAPMYPTPLERIRFNVPGDAAGGRGVSRSSTFGAGRVGIGGRTGATGPGRGRGRSSYAESGGARPGTTASTAAPVEDSAGTSAGPGFMQPRIKEAAPASSLAGVSRPSRANAAAAAAALDAVPEVVEWTEIDFVDGVRMHGRNFKKISAYLGVRALSACRQYFSQHRVRLGLDFIVQVQDPFLEPYRVVTGAAALMNGAWIIFESMSIKSSDCLGQLLCPRN